MESPGCTSSRSVNVSSTIVKIYFTYILLFSRGFDLVTLQSRFLIIGGTAETASHQSEVECYCAQQNCWVSGIHSVPIHLCGLACVSLSQDAFKK